MKAIDNVRACAGPGVMTFRSEGDGSSGGTLFGHFSVFNRWTEIRSSLEGNFLERVAPTAFDEAIANPAGIRVMFDHGQDPSIGQKPLGVIKTLRADDTGAYYEAELFRTSYVEELKPALAAGQLGASFRFSVPEGGDEWVDRPARSDYNPKGLPERTLHKVRTFEFGPVVFGAYPDATSGVRADASFTDLWYKKFGDPRVAREARRTYGDKTVDKWMTVARDIAIVLSGGEDSAQGAADGCCCCDTCGVMYDPNIATACPVCGEPTGTSGMAGSPNPAATGGPGMAEMNSATGGPLTRSLQFQIEALRLNNPRKA